VVATAYGNLYGKMTRILSELLGAREPAFRMGLHKLERASGCPSNDVRLTSEIIQHSKQKLHELGLDTHNTVGPELYVVLKEHLGADDERLRKALQAASQNQDIMASVAHALRTVPIPRSCFALKSVVVKKLFRKLPPKRAMKQLGYRSLDSMLKHEPVASLYAAAWLTESPAWCRSLTEQYKHLTASDFEVRDIAVVQPNSIR